MKLQATVNSIDVYVHTCLFGHMYNVHYRIRKPERERERQDRSRAFLWKWKKKMLSNRPREQRCRPCQRYECAITAVTKRPSSYQRWQTTTNLCIGCNSLGRIFFLHSFNVCFFPAIHECFAHTHGAIDEEKRNIRKSWISFHLNSCSWMFFFSFFARLQHWDAEEEEEGTDEPMLSCASHILCLFMYGRKFIFYHAMCKRKPTFCSYRKKKLRENGKCLIIKWMDR